MALFSKRSAGKKQTRSPDECGQISDQIGCAIWLNKDTGNHDVRVGPVFRRNGETFVKTTFPLESYGEMIEALLIVGETFVNDSEVNASTRKQLVQGVAALNAGLSALREERQNGTDNGSFFQSA